MFKVCPKCYELHDWSKPCNWSSPREEPVSTPKEERMKLDPDTLIALGVQRADLNGPGAFVHGRRVPPKRSLQQIEREKE